jgi:asparagine synthase (glutamine-hydrolysing)
LALVPRLAEIWQEPFADSSQIPTYLICGAARSQVTVALTGDGGDEMFGGYQRYLAGEKFWRRWRRLPLAFRRAAQVFAERLPPRFGNAVGDFFSAPYPRRWGDKFSRLARGFAAANFSEFYRRISLTGAEGIVIGAETNYAPNDEINFPDDDDFAALAMLDDQQRYLPDDLLVKIDRAAMAKTLETRAPLLDARIAEFAWSLPAPYKISGGAGKVMLRRLLAKYLPDASALTTPKKGFAAPIAQWLRGGLKTWAADLLDPTPLRADGFFAAEKVTLLWNEHQQCRRDHAPALWAILMFQSWHRAALSKKNPAPI